MYTIVLPLGAVVAGVVVVAVTYSNTGYIILIYHCPKKITNFPPIKKA